MNDEVKKTASEGAAEYHRLKKEAQGLGINTEGLKKADLIVAIESNGTADSDTERLRGEAVKLGIEATGMDKDELIAAIQRKQIAVTVRIEAEEREKLIQEHRLKQDRAEIIAESESLGIPIDLPDPCTVLQIAQARQKLGIQKKIPKPSPETIAIEASEKGYYIFNNLEQDDVDVSCNIGGKYRFDLIPTKIHCLPAYVIKHMAKKAIVPVYGKVKIPGAGEGSFQEVTRQTGTKKRFSFEWIDKAPPEAEFGVVLDESLVAKLLQKELV